eukprot:2645168-Amphidinium_carterae.1
MPYLYINVTAKRICEKGRVVGLQELAFGEFQLSHVGHASMLILVGAENLAEKTPQATPSKLERLPLSSREHGFIRIRCQCHRFGQITTQCQRQSATLLLGE